MCYILCFFGKMELTLKLLVAILEKMNVKFYFSPVYVNEKEEDV